jgi:hypothetical protein
VAATRGLAAATRGFAAAALTLLAALRIGAADVAAFVVRLLAAMLRGFFVVALPMAALALLVARAAFARALVTTLADFMGIRSTSSTSSLRTAFSFSTP